MTTIDSATAALDEAERILTTVNTEDKPVGPWKTVAGAPLAAIILACAHANRGFGDLAMVRDIVSRPEPDEAAPGAPSWVSVARLCPNETLGAALQSAAHINTRQRNSIKETMLDAVAEASRRARAR